MTNPQVDDDGWAEGCTCEEMAGLCPVHHPDICPTCGYLVTDEAYETSSR